MRRTVDERSTATAEWSRSLSGKWSRSMAARAHAGGRPNSDTTTMVPKASRTDHGAGCATRIATHPCAGGPHNVATIDPAVASNPTVTPAMAPGAVNRDHQIPRTSSGLNVDAATVNPHVTSVFASIRAAGNASTTTAAAARTTVTRNCRSPPASRSCEIAPDTTSSRPSDVARNAANAPAVSNAVNASPHGPWSTWYGNATTAVSVAPERYSCGT